MTDEPNTTPRDEDDLSATIDLAAERPGTLAHGLHPDGSTKWLLLTLAGGLVTLLGVVAVVRLTANDPDELVTMRPAMADSAVNVRMAIERADAPSAVVQSKVERRGRSTRQGGARASAAPSRASTARGADAKASATHASTVRSRTTTSGADVDPMASLPKPPPADPVESSDDTPVDAAGEDARSGPAAVEVPAAAPTDGSVAPS